MFCIQFKIFQLTFHSSPKKKNNKIINPKGEPTSKLRFQKFFYTPIINQNKERLGAL